MFAKIKKAVNDEGLVRQVAEEAKDSVVKRTREGKGVQDTGDAPRRLRGLKDKTVKNRRGLKRKGQLSRNTSPRKSNLTASGEMLDDVEVLKSSRKSATIGFKKEKNRTKATNVQRQGRNFFDLSSDEVEDIVKSIESAIKKSINCLLYTY